MTKTKLQIVDFFVASALVGVTTAACIRTELGWFEVLYFIPFVAYEIGCIIYSYKKGWLKRK